MSAPGQKATSAGDRTTSALPTTTDISDGGCDVRYVPLPDSCTAANSISNRSCHERALAILQGLSIGRRLFWKVNRLGPLKNVSINDAAWPFSRHF
jgi:hypothetical protein